MSACLRSPRLRSPILPPAPTVSHRPVTSGWPSALRGAGAARFGFPSAVRGMPGVRYCAHCAVSGITNEAKTIAVMKIFTGQMPPGCHYTPKTTGPDHRHALHATVWRVGLAIQYSRGALVGTRDALAIAPKSRAIRHLAGETASGGG